jgi:hypothetical protein
MLSTEKIFEAVAKHTAGSGARGFANVYLREHYQRRGNYGPHQVAFLKQLADTPRREPSPRAVHPADVARRGTEGRAPGAGIRPAGTSGSDLADELDPPSLMWLERLPSDPKDISFEDAVRLFRMVDSVKANTTSGMLLRSIAEPLDLLHTERVVRDRIANLPTPARVSDLARGALAEAVAGAHPELHPEEIAVRARRLTQDFEAEQEDRYDQSKAQLQAQLQGLASRRADRAATTATTFA